MNLARLCARLKPVFLSKKGPSKARLLTKMSPSEELGTLDSAKIVLKHLGHTCISRDLVQLLMSFATGYKVAWNARPTTYLLLLVAKITAFVS